MQLTRITKYSGVIAVVMLGMAAKSELATKWVFGKCACSIAATGSVCVVICLEKLLEHVHIAQLAKRLA